MIGDPEQIEPGVVVSLAATPLPLGKRLALFLAKILQPLLFPLDLFPILWLEMTDGLLVRKQQQFAGVSPPHRSTSSVTGIGGEKNTE